MSLLIITGRIPVPLYVAGLTKITSPVLRRFSALVSIRACLSTGAPPGSTEAVSV